MSKTVASDPGVGEVVLEFVKLLTLPFIIIKNVLIRIKNIIITKLFFVMVNLIFIFKREE
ncbi:MAG: hypothetical protein CMI53_00230 [Parcubacteria group bacterium]|nr:hypothetical protein [Parcubacteria group bacterium]